ncbi:hypothetical protein JCM30566_06660 [Marinitoga arctica]
MYYYICELIDDKNYSTKIAIEDKIIGVSAEFVEKNIDDNFLGYAKFKEILYPALTLPVKKNFILKMFLIFNSFAFGVTSIIKKVDVEKVETFPENTLNLFPHLKIFSGYFELEGEEIFTFNIDKITDEIPQNNIIEMVKKISKDHKKLFIPNYYILDNKYAIKKENVISITDKRNYCKFKYQNYVGFIEYKNKIYPVKEITEKNKWILLTSNMGLLCKKIDFVFGEEVLDNNKKKYFKSGKIILPILE